MAVRVSREEYEREVEELKRLREEYEPKWRRLYHIVSRIRYWERRIATLEARFAELRRIGWRYLHAPERREYLRIRDIELPKARAYWLGWDTERTGILTEIRRQRADIRRLEEEIARKIVIPILYRVKIRLYNEEISPETPTGQFQCVPPGTLVYTKHGIMPISKIRVGDEVLSHLGFRKVTKVFRRPFAGKLIEIKTRYSSNTILLTPEHPVLVIRAKTCTPNQRRICKPTCNRLKEITMCKRRHYLHYRLTWIHAEEINPKTDYLVFPRLPTGDRERVELPKVKMLGRNQFGSTFPHPTAHELPFEVPVNEKLMKLIGFYLAEGTAKKDGRSVTFSFHEEEKEYQEEVSSIIRELFNLPTSVYVQSETHSAVITVCSKALNKFFSQFGRNSKSKRIPTWVTLLPANKLYPLLEGYVKGDGGVYADRNLSENIVIGGTASQQLAYGLRLILYKLGIPHSLLEEKARDVWHIRCSLTYSKELAERIGLKLKTERNRKLNFGWVTDLYVAIPILWKREVSYDGEVFNLEVEEAQTYVLSNFIVHNCWFDIDAIIDEKTGLPKWDWWLTDREIRIAKRDMWAEFNAPESWQPIEGTLLAYMEERKGIAHATPEKVDETPVFIPRYPKTQPVPEEFRGKFTIEDLIVGLSSVAPKPVTEPEGVFKQKIMVIKEDEINYYREINAWIWRVPRTVKEEVKKELGIP